jgi:hypothetical protein
LRNPRHGYCLRYPDQYKVEKPNDGETILLIGGPLNATDPRVHINVQAAGGRTAAEAADQVAADFAGFDIARSTAMVAGEEAVVLDKLPGQEINRRVLFVHEDSLYDLMFMPADEAVGESFAGMQTLYQAVLDTFTLIPRTEALVDDCLQPDEDTLLLRDEAQGFCLLYPADYEVEQTSDSQTLIYFGSPMDVEHPKVFIEMTDAAGRTAEQAAEEARAELETSVPGSGVEQSFGWTLGYEPAMALENVPGQDISRQLFAVHDGRLYKLTFVPADEAAGEVHSAMLALFDLVVRSFRFL